MVLLPLSGTKTSCCCLQESGAKSTEDVYSRSQLHLESPNQVKSKQPHGNFSYDSNGFNNNPANKLQHKLEWVAPKCRMEDTYQLLGAIQRRPGSGSLAPNTEHNDRACYPYSYQPGKRTS